MRLIGGNFDGQNIQWNGDKVFAVFIPEQAVASVGEYISKHTDPSSHVMSATKTKQELYKIQTVRCRDYVYTFARPEHWTDEDAWNHIFGPGEYRRW